MKIFPVSFEISLRIAFLRIEKLMLPVLRFPCYFPKSMVKEEHVKQALTSAGILWKGVFQRVGVFVNPDNSAFQVALNSEIYVDKSGLIQYTNKVLNTLQSYICNSRPRRFGKSITANMLTAYYSKGCDSEAMFAGLEISESADFKKHLNKCDVIHIDVQWFLARLKAHCESWLPQVN